MNDSYNPKHYWDNRLSNAFNLRGVGHFDFSESYNFWLYRRKKRCIESCLREIPLKGKYVLDVGCGTGFFVEWYLKQGANVFGIDISDVSIRKLKELHKAEFFTQDISATDYQPYRKFDIVNMWDVIYHIVESNHFERALNNVSKSLKESGLFLLTDGFGFPSDVRLADHVQERSLSTYLQIMPEKGFELIRICPLYKTLNKTHFGKLDNYLAYFYFLIDNFSKKFSPDNLSLAVWRYNQPR